MLIDRLWIDEDFAYLSDDLPESLALAFGDSLKRARRLLTRRNEAQVVYALGSLDWMLRAGAERLDGEIREALAKDGIFFETRVKALQAYKAEIDLDEQPEFPEATWPEYFALLALGSAGETVYTYHHLPEPGEAPDGLDLGAAARQAFERGLHEHALEALDAVSHAERLHMEAELLGAAQMTAREAQRVTGRKGGKVRAAKYAELKGAVIDCFQKHHASRSNRDAAKRIYVDLKADVDRVLRTDDPEKALEKWIGEHKRAQCAAAP